MMLLPLALLSALYFKTSDGNIYHTIDEIPPGMCILNNNGTELVYEATNFNTCNEIVLQPGCYRAELRGGIGLQNEHCLSIAEQDFTPTISAIFSINEPTTVYVFRGGDGNTGGVNVVNNRYTGSFGGGASPNGAGGTDWQVRDNFINGDEYVNAGTNGTDERGGDGGDIYVCNNLSCTSRVSATGGIGGATVTYECGGQVAKTYGGGGGGGAYASHYSTAANGGNGGSGSTDHSDTSFVRIYKI